MKYYGIQNEVKAYINRLQDENGIFVSANDVKTINDRVESLKRSGVWSRFSLGFNDVDGDAYLTRAGVTNPLGRCEVLWFIRGTKSLNMWNTMACWPMRNIHNAGTGTVLYNFGGLGIYNGTLNNIITWDNTGLITTNGGNGSVSITFRAVTDANLPLTYFASNVRNSNDYISGVDALIGLGTGANFVSLSRRGPAGSSNIDDYTLRTTSGLILNTNFGTVLPFRWHTIYGAIRSTSAILNINNGITSSTSTAAAISIGTPSTAMVLSQRPSSGTGNSIQSIALVALNFEANNTLLNDLYKATLGNGLGLP